MEVPGLKEVRKHRGMTQLELSEKSGISRDSISNYEKGTREPWPRSVKRLADALGVSVDELRNPNPNLGEHAPHLEMNAKGISHLLDTFSTLEEMMEDLENLPEDERQRRMVHVRSVMGLLRTGLQDSLDYAWDIYRVGLSEKTPSEPTAEHAAV